jgi:hypothetical protein
LVLNAFFPLLLIISPARMLRAAAVYLTSVLLLRRAIAVQLAGRDAFCNPLARDCGPNPALGGTRVWDFTTSGSGSGSGGNSFEGFEVSQNASLLQPRNGLGAVFLIGNETDAPTLVSTKYIFFGQVDIEMQCAPGAGIVTSMVLQSDTLDEIDFVSFYILLSTSPD